MRNSKLILLHFILWLICSPEHFQFSNINLIADSSICESFYDTITNRTIYKTSTISAAVYGGDVKLFEALNKIKYTEIKSTLQIQTRLFVAFIVDTNGTITGKRIYRNINGTDIAEQVFKIVENQEWIPASCNDIPIPSLYLLPVNIEIK